MIKIRRAQERGHANYSWLDSYHSFSFGNYYDPSQMGFRSLRVINEDKIAPKAGFDTHGHTDMEIITIVLEGALEHKDSLGFSSVIQPGEIQKMSAGTGIFHSEYNASQSESVHLLQIWITPNKKGIEPYYEQEKIDLNLASSQFKLIAAPPEKKAEISLNQDAEIYLSLLKPQDKINYQIKPDRHVWVQVAKGEINLNEFILKTSDAAAISNLKEINITANNDSEVLLFDLA